MLKTGKKELLTVVRFLQWRFQGLALRPELEGFIFEAAKAIAPFAGVTPPARVSAGRCKDVERKLRPPKGLRLLFARFFGKQIGMFPERDRKGLGYASSL